MQACADELTVRPESDCEYYFVECDNAIVGYYGLQKTLEHSYELEALFIEPDYMGKGLGRALMSHAVQTARQQKAKRITIQGDPNAGDFYLACGARRIGECESGSIAGRMLPLFEITLDD